MIKTSAASGLALLSVLLLGAAPEESRRMPTRDVEDQGYRVHLDLGPQVLSIAIPEDRAFGEGRKPIEAPISPTLAGAGAGIISGSLLAQKGKQFDDGLYAAVELAAQRGAGRFAGKAAMLRDLAARTVSADDGVASGNAAVVLSAACRLGKVPVRVPASLEAVVASAEREFLANPLRSKPLGFYTWSTALADIYRQDRMLQNELKGASGIERLAKDLTADRRTRETYLAYMTLVDRLTNPNGSLRDLRGALGALESRRAAPEDGVAIFPASRSHEADLVMKLYGNQPIPEGFSLVEEIIRRIRAGKIDLKPSESSGWYDYQTWALEPLVIPEKMPEAARLRLQDDYRAQLLDLFKGVLALTRETHVKQLEVPPPSEAPANGSAEKPPVMIYVAPELSAEPLVTYYRRRAESYEFIQKWLLETFGKDGLETLRRQTASGPVATDLLGELDAMRALFLSASATTARQLGMAPDSPAIADESAFRKWAQGVDNDPDVRRDARMMVPVFYDQVRRKTKVWVFLGWSSRPVIVSFATPPSHEVFQKDRKLSAKEAPQVHFVPSYVSLAYPITAEVYVDKLLDRDEFRKLCDTHKTRAGILEHLK